MRQLLRILVYLFAIVGISAVVSAAAVAQGVTSAAVQGLVSREGGQPIEAANIVLTNTETGNRVATTSRSNGRFNFENVPPGGPYTLVARAIGFEPATKTGIMLTLGQRYVQDLELKAQVVTLQELSVVAVTNPLINSGRTGPAQIVTDTAIQRFPLLGRNFTDLIRTSPQVLSGTSIAGQNSKFNAIQIDGGANNDVFGLSTTGTPGGSAGAKPISLEAIQEFQILVAPFDVRQGSFSGGLVNGITKTGTNQFHGSAFGYMQRPELVGRDTGGVKFSNFDIKQYGGTFGGPIIRDKLHFFVSADLQESTTPFVGLSATEPATGISVATAQRAGDIIRSKYGFDPGGLEAPEFLGRPDKNLFGKLNYQLGSSSQVEVSYNYVRASEDNFNRTFRNDPTRDGWQLSNSGYKLGNTTNSLRGKYTTQIGASSLEVLVGYQTIRDAREIANRTPLILVQGDVINNYLAAGGERFSHGNELDQNVGEFSANFTFGLGSNHQITVGTHNEFFSFRNLFANNRYGTWTFGSVDSLDAGLARRYEILLETRPGGFTADFAVKQIGGYLQDTWRPTNEITITGGLRFDVPFSDKPFFNPDTTLARLGINTDRFPTGNVLFSPRLGFNWDIGGTSSTVVRGGVGLFSGRPPYVWMSNAFTNTGLEQVSLICQGTSPPPAFTTDPDNQPRACAAGGTPAPPAATINYFEENFKFQQSLKLSLGVDKQLGSGFVATVDFLHSRARNQMYQTDDNTIEGQVNGEGRLMYADPPATSGGAFARKRQSTRVLQVVRHSNRSGDRSTLISGQIQKSFANDFSFSAAYTHSKTKDLMSLTSSQATSNLRNTPLVGSLNNRELGVSAFDVPHKLTFSGTANLPFDVQISAIFTARAGTPYAYVYANDANGDGNISNDLFYVPTDAADISLATPADWDRLNAFITSESCLRDQRGKIMDRTSCRNPWSKFLDLRLSKPIRTLSGQSLLISADVFNFLNLVNSDWGINRETASFQQVNLLTLSGYDTRGTATQSDDRGIYTVPTALPAIRRVLVNSSRWRIQVGAKYIF